MSELTLKGNSSVPLSSSFKIFSSKICFKEWFKAQISFRSLFYICNKNRNKRGNRELF